MAVLVSVASAGGIEQALWWSAAIALAGAILALRLKQPAGLPALETV